MSGEPLINTNLNPSDLLTKNLPSGEKRNRFCGQLLHHLAQTEIKEIIPAAAAAGVTVPLKWIKTILSLL